MTTKIKPQQNIFLLDLPWGVRFPGVKYDKARKVSYFEGAILPAAMRPYRAPDFSYLRWVEDDINGAVMPPQPGAAKFTPKPHQVEAADCIRKSYEMGFPDFLESDHTGLGKTLSTLAGIASIASRNGMSPETVRAKVLVVCPKRAIPVWRQTLQNYPMAGQQLRVMVTNYHQLQKLLHEPASAKNAKTKRTKTRHTVMNGTPKIDWDFVIFDETQYLKNYPSSTMSLAAARVAKVNEPYTKGRSPFVVHVSATPGATPLNLSMMARTLGPLISPASSLAKKVTPSTWGSFLEREGFAVSKSGSAWVWAAVPFYDKNSADPKRRAAYEKKVKESKLLQRKDARRIGLALTSPGAPFIMRKPQDIDGWPEQQVIPMPVEIAPESMEVYREAWTRFRKFLRLPGSKQDPKTKLVENLRYRQKSSLLKVPGVVEEVIDWVESGFQVFISCEFYETMDKYHEALDAAKIPYVEISGRNKSDEEGLANRIAFQKGEIKVVISTILESISLHAEEILPDGTTASPAERITVVNDVRQNNLSTEQILGRCHRDGKNSLVYMPFIPSTIDARVIESYANKTANMKSMQGASEGDAEYLSKLFADAAATGD